MKLARTLLARRAGAVDNLSGTDLVAFLLDEGQRLSVGSVKGRIAELRSLLTFLYLKA